MKLTRFSPGMITGDRYNYTFLSMERLNLTCSKSKELPGAIYGEIIQNNSKTVLKTGNVCQ